MNFRNKKDISLAKKKNKKKQTNKLAKHSRQIPSQHTFKSITEKTCALMTVMLKKEKVCYIMNRLAVVKHKSSVSWLNSQKSVLCCLLLIKP